MQKQEVHRFTFMNSYKLNYSQKMNLTVPSSQIECEKMDEPTLVPSDDYRLSQNKIQLLEKFKQAISENDPQEVNKQQQDVKVIKSIMQVSLPCLQIKEQSQESESQLKTNQKSLPNDKEISKIIQKQQQQGKSKPNGVSYIFQEKSKLQKTKSQPDKYCQQLQLIKCSSQQIQRQINQFNQFLKILCKGIVVYKYCFYKNKKQKIGLYFSEDFQFMAIYNFQKDYFSNYSMKQFMSVTYGLKSNKFKQYIKNGWEINEEFCFSFIFKERSFDFYLENTDAIETIQSYFKVVNNN